MQIQERIGKTIELGNQNVEIGTNTAEMVGKILEQRTPVKGTPVKGPVRGQGTPGASVRGQGTPTPPLEVGGQQPLELQTLNGWELQTLSPLTEQPTEQLTELDGYSYSLSDDVESYSLSGGVESHALCVASHTPCIGYALPSKPHPHPHRIPNHYPNLTPDP